MTRLAVDCTFSSDGSVRIRRVKIDKRWQAVSQGRQWLDQNGRHVLIMLDENKVREVILRPDTLAWEMRPMPGGHRVV